MKKIVVLITVLLSISFSYAQENYFEWTGSRSFQNGIDNQVAYLNFGDAKLWGYVEVTITGGYGHRLTSGTYTKRIRIVKNFSSEGNYFNQSSEVPANFGPIGDEWKIGEFEFVNNNLRIPIYHLSNKGNTIRVLVKGLSVQSYNVNNLSITNPVVITNNEDRDNVSILDSKVGIGTTTPSGKLTIKHPSQDSNGIGALKIEGSGSASLRIGANNDYSWIQSHGSRPLYINELGNNTILNKNGGNVGIGTVMPGEKLEVKGNMKVSSSTYNTIYKNIGINGSNHLILQADASYLRLSAPNNYINLRGGNGTRIQNTDGSITHLMVNSSGDVGIGTTSPDETLTVSKRGVTIGIYDTNPLSNANNRIARYGNSLVIQNDLNGSWSDNVNFVDNGSVGIGVKDFSSDYKLAVAGKVISEEVTVQLQSTWPDYVFTDNYELPTLEEVEQHISEKGHLVNIPSAKEVEEKGIQLGEMNKKLLEKIEELTLYIIQQEKKLKKQEEKNKKLEARLAKIEELLQQNR
ncbi:hypothetical protein [Tenacibaculum amylolyticum]|uniref:hypothetical protein n=1 Tax=Tenacibaculum amylolyticum TaxID=104269 RepID=UPI0038941D0F